MWGFLMWVALAVWVFLDAKKRANDNQVGYAIGTALIGFIVLPLYLAKRNLLAGEVREGGTGWNFCKNFALFWTLTWVVAGVAGMVGASQVVGTASSDAEAAGAAVGATIGLGLIGFLWFAGVVPALVTGLILKKSSIVERGPTGPLATRQAVPSIPAT